LRSLTWGKILSIKL